MTDLYKSLAQHSQTAIAQELAKAQVKRNAELARNDSDRPGVPALMRTAKKCYVPAFCSKTRKQFLYVCEYESGEAIPWIAREAILYESKASQTLPDNSSFATADVRFRGSEAACVCPACRLRTKTIRVEGRTVETSSFICNECNSINCFGSYEVVGRELKVTCGNCSATGYMGSAPYEGSHSAITEAVRRTPPPASSPASRSPLGPAARKQLK